METPKDLVTTFSGSTIVQLRCLHIAKLNTARPHVQANRSTNEHANFSNGEPVAPSPEEGDPRQVKVPTLLAAGDRKLREALEAKAAQSMGRLHNVS